MLIITVIALVVFVWGIRDRLMGVRVAKGGLPSGKSRVRYCAYQNRRIVR